MVSSRSALQNEPNTVCEIWLLENGRESAHAAGESCAERSRNVISGGALKLLIRLMI
jgi:hypothetical protein